MPRPGRMTTERAKDFKGTLLQLVRNLGRYRLSLVPAIVFAILSLAYIFCFTCFYKIKMQTPIYRRLHFFI